MRFCWVRVRQDFTEQRLLTLNIPRLNLTVASCAYLMEPSWNPTVEDQALARIHRMGQTKETRTVRFFIKGSLEEVRSPRFSRYSQRLLILANDLQHIMRTQKSKEGLASLILQPSDRPGVNSKIEALKVYLPSRITTSVQCTNRRHRKYIHFFELAYTMSVSSRDTRC
jgi:hypothetical protein